MDNLNRWIVEAGDIEGGNVAATRPEFSNSPLVEQAITVVFEPLAGFSIVHFGLLWQAFSAEFPETSGQAVREPIIERLDDRQEPTVRFKLLPDDGMSRAIFRSLPSHEQIQVQSDLFSFSWLKVGGASYPRSEPLVTRFRTLFERFSRFLQDAGLSVPKLVQCELVNVNIIPVTDLGTGFDDASRFFALPDLKIGLPHVSLESYVLQGQYALQNETGKVIGRLRHALAPVSRIDDGDKAYRFELTARGVPPSSNLEGAMAFFGLGRDAINATFVAATTADAHRHWGLSNG